MPFSSTVVLNFAVIAGCVNLLMFNNVEASRTPTMTLDTDTTSQANADELPIYSFVRSCILAANGSASFDILIDIAQNPQTNEQLQKVQHTTSLGRFFGKYFGPIFIDYIKSFIASVEVDMDSTKLYTVILDGSTKYYLNESTLWYDETVPLTTTQQPNAFVGFFRRIGASIQGFFHSSSGNAIAGSESEKFDPSGAHLPKITSLALKARARGDTLRLPQAKSVPTNFTIVITDGAQNTPISLYPPRNASIILDIGGGWSSSSTARRYTTKNVIVIEEPQQLEKFVQTCRYMICQAIGGVDGRQQQLY